MTTIEAVRRINIAIATLQDYSASQNPYSAASIDEAIGLLEEVKEALRRRKLQYMPFAA